MGSEAHQRATLPALEPRTGRWAPSSAVLWRELAEPVDGESRLPLIVTYVVDGTTGRRPIHATGLAPAAKADLIRHADHSWLARADAPQWKPIEGLGSPVLLAVGDDFTSSGLAVEKFLLKAHRYFESPRLYISAPDRHTLITAEDADRLAGLSIEYYVGAVRSRQAALCPHVFLVESGRVSSVVPPSAGSSAAADSGGGDVAEVMTRAFLLIAGADHDVRPEAVAEFQHSLEVLAEASLSAPRVLTFAAQDVLREPTAILAILAREGEDSDVWWGALREAIRAWRASYAPVVLADLVDGISWLVDRVARTSTSLAERDSARERVRRTRDEIERELRGVLAPPSDEGERGSFVLEGEGGRELVITLARVRPIELGRSIADEFWRWIGSPKHLDRFDGSIRFFLDPASIPLDPELERRVAATITGLTRACREQCLRNPRGQPIRVAAEWRAAGGERTR